MLIPTHPELLSNSRVEDLSGGFPYWPQMVAQASDGDSVGAGGADGADGADGSSGSGAGGGARRPSIHQRRRRCSATPVLTGRATLPAPHSPAFRGPHTPRRASTPGLPTTGRSQKSGPSHSHTPGALHRFASAQGRSARDLEGSRGPAGQYGDRPGSSNMPGMSGMPGTPEDREEGLGGRLANGADRSNPPPQPQGTHAGRGGQGIIPSVANLVIAPLESAHSTGPRTPASAIFRPDLPNALHARASAGYGGGDSLSVRAASFQPGRPSHVTRGARAPASSLVTLPPLSVVVNGRSGPSASRPSSQSSSTTSSISIDTPSERPLEDSHSRARDHAQLDPRHPPTPLTARPSERTPTMGHAHAYTDLRTPIASNGNLSPIERLHAQAPRYWCDRRSSDLFLVVPTHHPDGRLKAVGSRSSSSSESPPPEPLPPSDSIPSMGLAVHCAYLCSQSGLLHRLLSSQHPISTKGCCILPSLPGSPTSALREIHQVLLPLPDPKSFPFLLHWLYWGDVRAFERALSSGTVNWNGVIANADFLEVDTRTKKVVAHWWRRWVQFAPEGRTQPDTFDDQDEDADIESGSESDVSEARSEAECLAAEEMTKLLNNL